jgi:hypothetical protein
MARTDPYLTVAEFKERVNITTSAQDGAIETALKAASRQIDNFCGRTFTQSAEEARYLTALPWRGPLVGSGVVLPTDEFVSLTEIATDDGSGAYATVIAAEDYRYLPLSAPAEGEPYTAVDLLNNLGWPTGADAIRLTGIWGWPEVPAVIAEATHLTANRLRALWTAPFGSTGMGEMGGGLNMTTALSPLIREMLAPYRVLAV